jgi:hypothetical protein
LDQRDTAARNSSPGYQSGIATSMLLLAATLFAHCSAAFDVHVLAGLGGDAVLA